MAFDTNALKKTFFDSDAVTSAVDKATIKALSKIGAFVRRKQKSLVRYRKKASTAGQPPSAHRSEKFSKEKKNKKTGAVSRQQSSPLRELIFFGYDASTKSVVEGPAKFFKRQAGLGGDKTVPETLEDGGVVVKLVPVPQPTRGRASPAQSASFKRLIAEGRIEKKPREYHKRAVRIAARPSAKPALDAEMPKFADTFKNAVTGR